MNIKFSLSSINGSKIYKLYDCVVMEIVVQMWICRIDWIDRMTGTMARSKLLPGSNKTLKNYHFLSGAGVHWL